MSVRKEDLFHLIEQLHDRDREAIYDLAKYLAHRPLILRDEDGQEYGVEGENAPLSETEKEALKEADQQVEEGDVVDWEDAKRELGL